MLLITDMVSASADSLEPQQQTFQNTLWFRSRQTGNRVAVVNLMGPVQFIFPDQGSRQTKRLVNCGRHVFGSLWIRLRVTGGVALTE